jgi:hypothetical protein
MIATSISGMSAIRAIQEGSHTPVPASRGSGRIVASLSSRARASGRLVRLERAVVDLQEGAKLADPAPLVRTSW